MRLRKLSVRNTKLLRDVRDIDFEGRHFTALVGPNGLCKSTLLQCIALAAVGPEIGNQLARDVIPSMPDRRLDRPHVEIEATFDWNLPDGGSTSLVSSLEVPPGTTVLRGSSEVQGRPDDKGLLLDARARGDGGNLVVGYGVGRQLPVPQPRREEEDLNLDRLRSIFEPTHSLLGTNFANRFSDALAREFARALREVLVEQGILPNVADLELRGYGGVDTAERLVDSHRFKLEKPDLKLPARWLSQGYQQTISWVADLVGHAWMDAGERAVPPGEMTGIALIDEMDLSLHPRWQRELVPALRRAFPHVQFICTTHSPMLLPGFREDEILMISQDAEGSVSVDRADEDPRLLTSAGIYAEFFGVRSTFPNEIGEKLDQFTFLATDAYRSDEEDARMQALRQQLEDARMELDLEPVERKEPSP